MVADSDVGADRISKLVSEQINFPNWGLVLPDPFIETWLFDDIEEFRSIRKDASKSKMWDAFLKKSESLDVEKLAEKDSEFRKYIEEIRSSGGG